MATKGSEPTPPVGEKDVCDISGLTGASLVTCKSCLTTLNLAGTTTVTADQITAINACRTKAGGATTTPTEASTAEKAAMAAKKAAGGNPCSASGLSPAVQAACSDCYQTGMSDADLVACVNGKLAAAAGPAAVATAALKKYALPIALGVVAVGGIAYATHGKYWGKKGTGKAPAKTPPRVVRPRHK